MGEIPDLSGSSHAGSVRVFIVWCRQRIYAKLRLITVIIGVRSCLVRQRRMTVAGAINE